MMKRILWVVTLVITCITRSTAQGDTTRREFWPLGPHDLWQYKDENGRVSGTFQVTIADTVLRNGGRYAAIGVPPNFTTGYDFDRIDSLFRVQWYAPWAADSCGGSLPEEASVYRLREDSGKVWKNCYNWNGFLGRPLIRYAGIRHRSVFGQVREVMVFQHGFIVPTTGDTVFGGTEDLHARGIGLIWRDFAERAGYEYLSGAIINGVQYGIIVGVGEDSLIVPEYFSLGQNYPNPFNPATTIRYQIPASMHVRLTIFNLLGQQVSVLVDKEQPAGVYEVNYEADQLASGVYFYRIFAGEHAITRKMILQK